MVWKEDGGRGSEKKQRGAEKIEARHCYHRVSQWFPGLDETIVQQLSSLVMDAKQQTDKWLSDEAEGLVGPIFMGKLIKIGGYCVRVPAEIWEGIETQLGPDTGMCFIFYCNYSLPFS